MERAEGGLLVAWWDHRNVDAGTSQDIYAQRIGGDGTEIATQLAST